MKLAIGVAIGVGVGFTGGWVLRRARRSRWAAEEFLGVAVLALALLAYATALATDGNGFVAAFCAGLAFGAAAGRRGPAELVFIEQTSGAVCLLVWLAFGAIAVPILVDMFDWSVLLYAVLSLTVVRTGPVALALVQAASAPARSFSSAGSVPADWQRWSSRCSPSKRSGPVQKIFTPMHRSTGSPGVTDRPANTTAVAGRQSRRQATERQSPPPGAGRYEHCPARAGRVSAGLGGPPGGLAGRLGGPLAGRVDG